MKESRTVRVDLDMNDPGSMNTIEGACLAELYRWALQAGPATVQKLLESLSERSITQAEGTGYKLDWKNNSEQVLRYGMDLAAMVGLAGVSRRILLDMHEMEETEDQETPGAGDSDDPF